MRNIRPTIFASIAAILLGGGALFAQTNLGIFACSTSQWISSIGLGGVPTCTQPAFSDISGKNTVAAGGTNITSATDVSATVISRALSIQNTGSTNDSASGSGAFIDFTPTFTVPANFFVANRVIRTTAHFRLTTGAAPTALDVQLRYGATVVAQDGAAVTPAINLANNQFTLVWVTQATAAPGAAVNTETGIVTGFNSIGNTNAMSGTAQPVALATNGTLALTIASKWAGAGTGVNQLKLSQLIVEALN